MTRAFFSPFTNDYLHFPGLYLIERLHHNGITTDNLGAQVIYTPPTLTPIYDDSGVTFASIALHIGAVNPATMLELLSGEAPQHRAVHSLRLIHTLMRWRCRLATAGVLLPWDGVTLTDDTTTPQRVKSLDTGA